MAVQWRPQILSDQPSKCCVHAVQQPIAILTPHPLILTPTWHQRPQFLGDQLPECRARALQQPIAVPAENLLCFSLVPQGLQATLQAGAVAAAAAAGVQGALVDRHHWHTSNKSRES
eukprot:1159635-Pelagomonas_calceolata.AAC.7